MTLLAVVAGLVFLSEPQSRSVSQLSPLQIEVVKSGRVTRLSTAFRPGENIQIRAQTKRNGRFYFFHRESESDGWQPLAARSAFAGRIATVSLKTGPHGNDVLVVLGFEELDTIDPATIAAEQTPPPGATVSWNLPGMAVLRARIRVR